jgi:hypothetical protein
MGREIKVNMNTLERFARILIGGGLLLLAIYIPMSAALSWILVVVGVLLMLTGLSGFSLVYYTLNINTGK